jgi:hypothetical protein
MGAMRDKHDGVEWAAHGLPLDERTWSQLLQTAASVGVSRDEVEAAGFPAPGATRRG